MLFGDIMSTLPPNQALANRLKEFIGNLKRKADDHIDSVMMSLCMLTGKLS